MYCKHPYINNHWFVIVHHILPQLLCRYCTVCTCMFTVHVHRAKYKHTATLNQDSYCTYVCDHVLYTCTCIVLCVCVVHITFESPTREVIRREGDMMLVHLVMDATVSTYHHTYPLCMNDACTDSSRVLLCFHSNQCQVF